MTCRLEDGLLYVQNYNAENRLSAIHKMDGTDCDSQGEIVESWLFVYDGDGTRVKTVVMENGNIAETTYYFGGVEMRVAGEATTTKTYYSLAGQLVGMRTVDCTGEGENRSCDDPILSYFLTDHLGSVSAILGSTGALVREQRYKPYGEVRGDLGGPVITQTDVGYTGQRAVSGTGLMDYRARFYDPLLYRFVQPDTIVPSAGDPQSWNRYSYGLNNSSRYTDPTGHSVWDGGSAATMGDDWWKRKGLGLAFVNGGKPGLHPGQREGRRGVPPGVTVVELPPDCAYTDQYACNHPTQRLTAGTPDYLTLNFGGSIPGLGTVISGQLAVTVDRFGNVYVGPGLSFGPEAPLGFSASISPGYLNTWTNAIDPDMPEEGPPGEQRSENKLSGWFGNISVCLVFCGGLTNSLSSPNNVGFELFGLGVPQMSIGGGYSFLIDFTPNNGKPLW